MLLLAPFDYLKKRAAKKEAARKEEERLEYYSLENVLKRRRKMLDKRQAGMKKWSGELQASKENIEKLQEKKAE